MIFKIFIWSIIVYGITQIIVESEIFDGFRRWVSRNNPMVGTLVTCMLCSSVWISFIVSALLWSPVEAMFPVPDTHLNTFRNIFFDGMLGSAIAWFIALGERVITSIVTFLKRL